MKHIYLLVLIGSILMGNQHATAQTSESQAEQFQNRIVDSIFSNTLSESRDFWLRLPDNFQPGNDKKYAVIYQMDGFTSSINWYRNLDRNWHLLADIDPIIQQSALMIYGEKDMIPKFEGLSAFVPNVEELSIECGHWIQQEKPKETNQAILNWLEKV